MNWSNCGIKAVVCVREQQQHQKWRCERTVLTRSALGHLYSCDATGPQIALKHNTAISPCALTLTHTQLWVCHHYPVVVRGVWVLVAGDDLRSHPVRCPDEGVPAAHGSIQLSADAEVHCGATRETPEHCWPTPAPSPPPQKKRSIRLVERNAPAALFHWFAGGGGAITLMMNAGGGGAIRLMMNAGGGGAIRLMMNAGGGGALRLMMNAGGGGALRLMMNAGGGGAIRLMMNAGGGGALRLMMNAGGGGALRLMMNAGGGGAIRLPSKNDWILQTWHDFQRWLDTRWCYGLIKHFPTKP